MAMKRKNLVVLTGAGMSAESGLKTFRGEDGLWEGVPIVDVATPEAWRRDYKKVLQFYNERRKAVRAAQPNAGHLALAQLSNDFNVFIITQNVDDLHERAGSPHVLHLHGEITKSQSSLDPTLIYPMESDTILPGEKCELGSQLRPFIVWFGEPVPMMDEAIRITATADIFAIIGTSLEVYPAAGLSEYVRPSTAIYLIDPSPPKGISKKITIIRESASRGVSSLAAILRGH